jgi:hypothetical protein
LENVIGTWYALSMPQTYYPYNGQDNCYSSGPGGTCNNQQMTNYAMAPTFWNGGAVGEEADAGDIKNNKILGSIFYLRGGNFISSGSSPQTAHFAIRRGIGHTLQDVFVYLASGFTGSSSLVAMDLGTAGECTASTCTGTANRITSVGPKAPTLNVIGTSGATNCSSSQGWTLSNCSVGTTVPTGSSDPFTGTTAANLCYRYIDGVRQDGTGGTTVQPLWPWPMDQRIKDTMTLAGVTQQPCGDASHPCTGGRLSRVESINTSGITGEIESLLGISIPASCRNL